MKHTPLFTSVEPKICYRSFISKHEYEVCYLKWKNFFIIMCFFSFFCVFSHKNENFLICSDKRAGQKRLKLYCDYLVWLPLFGCESVWYPFWDPTHDCTRVHTWSSFPFSLTSYPHTLSLLSSSVTDCSRTDWLYIRQGRSERKK